MSEPESTKQVKNPRPVIREVWVDVGGKDDISGANIPMSVIDQHPKVWKNLVTGEFVPREYWGRFRRFVLAPDNKGAALTVYLVGLASLAAMLFFGFKMYWLLARMG